MRNWKWKDPPLRRHSDITPTSVRHLSDIVPTSLRHRFDIASTSLRRDFRANQTAVSAVDAGAAASVGGTVGLARLRFGFILNPFILERWICIGRRLRRSAGLCSLESFFSSAWVGGSFFCELVRGILVVDHKLTILWSSFVLGVCDHIVMSVSFFSSESSHRNWRTPVTEGNTRNRKDKHETTNNRNYCAAPFRRHNQIEDALLGSELRYEGESTHTEDTSKSCFSKCFHIKSRFHENILAKIEKKVCENHHF